MDLLCFRGRPDRFLVVPWILVDTCDVHRQSDARFFLFSVAEMVAFMNNQAPLPSTPVLTARAYWITARMRGEIKEEGLPKCGDQEVLLQALYSGVSRGTEALVHAGRVPHSVHDEMRAPRQEGNFPWPVKYGYCLVAQVLAGPPELLSKNVLCLHPHQDRCVVGVSEVHLLPNELPSGRAVLAPNMETALNALWDSEIKAGDRVVVVGAGVVGCLVAYLCARHPAVNVQVIDPASSRASAVSALGAELCSPESTPAGADLVFHASGHPDGLALSLSLAGKEARVVDLSWYGTSVVPLELGGQFHLSRLTLRASQVGQLPLCQRARWTHRRRLQVALGLCVDPALDILISGESEFLSMPRDLPAVLEAEGTLCHRIRY